MDGNVSDTVAKFLESKGAPAEDLPRSLLRKLIAADEAICRRLQTAREAEAAMKGSKITVAAIAADIGVTRKTIYDNPLLLEYVAAGAKKQKALKANSEDVRRLRDKNRSLEDRLGKMMRRDVEAEDLKVEIANMAKALKEKNTLIVNLQASNDRLRRELAVTKSKIPPTRGNIIELASKEAGCQ